MAHSIWHVAFAVTDLDRGMQELSEAFGVTWRPLREFEVTLHDGDDVPVRVPFRGTFSREGSPAIEIFEAVPGTPLAQHGDNPFHHMGYWVDDRPVESARLLGLGWPCIASAEPPENRVGLNIHRSSQGIGAELCDVRDLRPEMRDLYPVESPWYRPLDDVDQEGTGAVPAT